MLEVNKIFPGVHIVNVKGVRDLIGGKLWLESVLWAAKAFIRSVTSANAGMLSPQEVFYGGRPPISVAVIYPAGIPCIR